VTHHNQVGPTPIHTAVEVRDCSQLDRLGSKTNPPWPQLHSNAVKIFALLTMLTIPCPASDKADARLKPIDIFTVGREVIEGVDDARKYVRYREQCAVVTEKDVLVMICQARNDSAWSDRSGQDLVCKTSTDSARTWSQGRLIVTHGDKSICPNAAVYDRLTGRIHLLYNLFEWPYQDPASRKSWPDPRRRQYHLYSDNDGQTWSKPREISHMMRRPGSICIFGSGEGIQLAHGPHKGRLIVPGGHFDDDGKKFYVYYSDDAGQTWKTGEPVPCGACESSIAELPDGTLLVNNRGLKGYRRWGISTDQGITWSGLDHHKQLPSVSCNGSIITAKDPQQPGRTYVLCSRPVGKGRRRGVVSASIDGGKTWPISKVAVPGPFAYSSLAVLPDGHIGLFYETNDYEKVCVARFTLGWLLDR